MSTQRICWSPNSWCFQTYLIWQHNYPRCNQFIWGDRIGTKYYRSHIMKVGCLDINAWGYRKGHEETAVERWNLDRNRDATNQGPSGLWGAGRNRRDPSPGDAKEHGLTDTSVPDSCPWGKTFLFHGKVSADSNASVLKVMVSWQLVAMRNQIVSIS